MKQKITLSEKELNKIISESIIQAINEQVDESLFGTVADTVGGAVDAFRKGGSYAAHRANRELTRARNDKANLMRKYGVENGQNMNTVKRNMTHDKISANDSKYNQEIQYLEQEKQAAIQQITAKYDNKIAKLKQRNMAANDKVNHRADNRIKQYQEKNAEVTARQKDASNRRRTAMDANPYADFTE